MWLWHMPTLCNAATANRAVQSVQAISLLVMGVIFWWPIFGPRMEQRLLPLVGMLYLFSACLACTALGAFITFAPISVCSIYLAPVDRLGILPLIREGWGLTPRVDQQIGGLMMWVPSCVVYVGGILTLLARWYSEPEEQPVAATTEMLGSSFSDRGRIEN